MEGVDMVSDIAVVTAICVGVASVTWLLGDLLARLVWFIGRRHRR